ncbi:hypothetical protein BESB_072810 [Besnoitia besnoiti]|uniref:Vesicle transport v-SNARE N-terminal domain-containing protein n=1 Tax=Besnoitia besnoiti TaxID=94643 RepID=A0A2A9M881_BESBE|nr:uncharacterized protein BESB_072810 [Besnoitia besnoiti]PFH34129.1 hypothetical protein BESB_072810 [Besnoitia besnoiti]
MWQDYLSEFSGLHAEAERLLAAEAQAAEPLEARQHKLDVLLKKMKRCFSSLDMEVRSLPRPERQPLEASLTTCRRQFEDIQRGALLLGGEGRSPGQANALRRNQSALDKLQRGNSQLEQSCRIAAEAEKVGEAALCSLYVQRETLSRTMTRTKEVQRNMDEADTVLTKMSKWWNGIW